MMHRRGTCARRDERGANVRSTLAVLPITRQNMLFYLQVEYFRVNILYRLISNIASTFFTNFSFPLKLECGSSIFTRPPSPLAFSLFVLFFLHLVLRHISSVKSNLFRSSFCLNGSHSFLQNTLFDLRPSLIEVTYLSSSFIY